MAVVIALTTTLFDVTKERANPINPIAGESLLLWLRQKLGPGRNLTPPEPEDWGWYAMLDWNGRQYLIGASSDEPEGGEREWILQIDKQRSVSEKLLGREKMGGDDPCARFIRQLIESEPGFSVVRIA
jgi:hypothetical protein